MTVIPDKRIAVIFAALIISQYKLKIKPVNKRKCYGHSICVTSVDVEDQIPYGYIFRKCSSLLIIVAFIPEDQLFGRNKQSNIQIDRYRHFCKLLLAQVLVKQHIQNDMSVIYVLKARLFANTVSEHFSDRAARVFAVIIGAAVTFGFYIHSQQPFRLWYVFVYPGFPKVVQR